jgi:hypothetical protein
MSARHPADDDTRLVDALRGTGLLPLGPATATGPSIGLIPTYPLPEPAPLPSASLTPPPPTWTAQTAADALPPGPPAAEVAAVRALPLDARRALCRCAGPGWTIFAEGPAVPRLAPPDAGLVGVAFVAWLPTDTGAILGLLHGGPTLERVDDGEWLAYGQGLSSSSLPTPRLAALTLMARVCEWCP